MDENRREFLLRMYDQMFNDINRHILVVWQSVGVIVGAFALLALVEKGIVSSDVASGIILLLCAWSIAHIYDSSYWYNRNLVIITNIERQFLGQKDLKEIHWYFSAHRKNNKMISHLKIQIFLSISLSSVVTLYHFSTSVFPGFGQPWSNFELQKTIPYIVIIISFFFLKNISKGKDARYQEFIEKSPGKEMNLPKSNDNTIGHGQ
jgi:hypothetical protein